ISFLHAYTLRHYPVLRKWRPFIMRKINLDTHFLPTTADGIAKTWTPIFCFEPGRSENLDPHFQSAVCSRLTKQWVSMIKIHRFCCSFDE
ncbi:MAG: hypothetical protein JXR49_01620, partial [Acidobacteria bacterium]|nr:hypothetical protein [Acidobacteriota bacterium]